MADLVLVRSDMSHSPMDYLPITYTAKQLCVDGGRCSDICAVVEFEEKCFCPIGFNLTTPTECTGN